VSDRQGIRGGDTATLPQARSLHETYKAQTVEAIRLGIAKALRRGRFHADDLAHLEIPEEHLNLIGTTVASFVKRGLMVEVDRRKGTSKASKGRKSGIFEATEKGRQLIGSERGGDRPDPPSPAAPSLRSGCLRRPLAVSAAARAQAEDALIRECDRQVQADPSLRWDDPEPVQMGLAA
jgi:hypothetical protein